MSAQRELVPQVVPVLAGASPTAGLLLTGSVRYGYERETSDVDLFMITEAFASVQVPGAAVSHRTVEAWVANLVVGAMRVEIVCTSYAYLQQVALKPWQSYTLGDGEILLDPLGLLGPFQARMRAWFAYHPALAQAWRDQIAQCRAYALAGRPADRAAFLRFPRWEDFAAHMDAMAAAELGNEEGSVPRRRGDSQTATLCPRD